MSESETPARTSVSGALTVEEVAEYWDTHSLDDHWDETREAEFEVRAARRRRVTLDPDVYDQIAERARARGLLPETLVNLWLQGHLMSLAEQSG